MNALAMNQSSYNNLQVDLQTSSGDKISLNMYDNKEMSYASAKDGNSSAMAFSLSHEYGYEFSYKGNGIDEQDMQEITELLKALEPTISGYMENVEESGIPKPGEILNKAFDIKQQLPEPKDENHKNMIFDNLLNTFDNSMQKFDPSENILQASKTLFDNILKQFEEFGVYA